MQNVKYFGSNIIYSENGQKLQMFINNKNEFSQFSPSFPVITEK